MSPGCVGFGGPGWPWIGGAGDGMGPQVPLEPGWAAGTSAPPARCLRGLCPLALRSPPKPPSPFLGTRLPPGSGTVAARPRSPQLRAGGCGHPKGCRGWGAAKGWGQRHESQEWLFSFLFLIIIFTVTKWPALMIFTACSFNKFGTMNKCKVHRELLLKATVAVLFFSFPLWFLNPDGALLRVFFLLCISIGKGGGGKRITQLLAICFVFFDT